ncbi:hypothetical protein AJ79_00715 [Helicocarpus griseus UAMH5409]|uniref:Uncharacterized protein n=1 Tax=Helicocarpus griseus UAMH5409 TaxID=1447875 RepID=A0A2B7YBW8_9EURO|nr:hypothetical protein AJ79_00715 [Helicocarpus griseus UAMH5409]
MENKPWKLHKLYEVNDPPIDPKMHRHKYLENLQRDLSMFRRYIKKTFEHATPGVIKFAEGWRDYIEKVFEKEIKKHPLRQHSVNTVLCRIATARGDKLKETEDKYNKLESKNPSLLTDDDEEFLLAYERDEKRAMTAFWALYQIRWKKRKPDKPIDSEVKKRFEADFAPVPEGDDDDGSEEVIEAAARGAAPVFDPALKADPNAAIVFNRIFGSNFRVDAGVLPRAPPGTRPLTPAVAAAAAALKKASTSTLCGPRAGAPTGPHPFAATAAAVAFDRADSGAADDDFLGSDQSTIRAPRPQPPPST